LRFGQIALYFEPLLPLSAGGKPDGTSKRPPVRCLFAPPVGSFHRWHRGAWKLFGMLPK